MASRFEKTRMAILLTGAMGLMLSACEVGPSSAHAQAATTPSPTRSGQTVALPTNRAYSGAPPTVGHEVRELGRFDCLSCHRDGDVVDSRGRRAQITPHPELERCLQCHVAQRAGGEFKANQFRGAAYGIGLRSQPNGPWLIPHPLTLRENCIGCHGENASNSKLKTDHPERERCLQCHVPANVEYPKARPGVTREAP